jgi:hypothetical protein
MDERAYAKALARFMARVARANFDAKLMLDGLKEWGRHFQPKRAGKRGSGNRAASPRRPPPRPPAAGNPSPATADAAPTANRRVAARAVRHL